MTRNWVVLSVVLHLGLGGLAVQWANRDERAARMPVELVSVRRRAPEPAEPPAPAPDHRPKAPDPSLRSRLSAPEPPLVIPKTADVRPERDSRRAAIPVRFAPYETTGTEWWTGRSLGHWVRGLREGIARPDSVLDPHVTPMDAARATTIALLNREFRVRRGEWRAEAFRRKYRENFPLMQ